MMADQMQAIERLEAVDGMLEGARTMADTFYVRDDIRQARQELQQTIAQLRAESEQAARALRWALTLLKRERDERGYAGLPQEEREAITRTIALLEGGEEDV